VLVITDSAAIVLRALLDAEDAPNRAVRISEHLGPALDSGNAHTIRVEVVAEAPDEDEVLNAPGGLHVCVEPHTARLLDDKVLDGSSDEPGRPSLVLIAASSRSTRGKTCKQASACDVGGSGGPVPELISIPLPHLTAAILEVNAQLDAGKRCEIAEVKARVVDGSLFEWLRTSGIETLQFTSNERTGLLLLFGSLDEVANERRKFGVERNGYALVLAWLVEALQQRLASEGLYPV
jgi:Fe-S cluster assembly iron-binding protein IscA